MLTGSDPNALRGNAQRATPGTGLTTGRSYGVDEPAELARRKRAYRKGYQARNARHDRSLKWFMVFFLVLVSAIVLAFLAGSVLFAVRWMQG